MCTPIFRITKKAAWSHTDLTDPTDNNQTGTFLYSKIPQNQNTEMMIRRVKSLKS